MYNGFKVLHQTPLLGSLLVGGANNYEVTTCDIAKSELPSVLCWIMCDNNDLKRVEYVKNSWTRFCDKVLFLSSVSDHAFPTIGLNVSSGRTHVASKAKAAWKYIYSHYINHFDYFFKADPDTYAILRHMKAYLRSRNASQAEYMGHSFMLPDNKTRYHSGGPGESQWV